MYVMNWDITFETETGVVFGLAMLAEVEITKSVSTLVDTAIITLPETHLNSVIEHQIYRGMKVLIRLGYDDKLEDEFKGYVQRVAVTDRSVKIMCEDDIYLFRKPVKNAELKPVSLKKIAQTLVNQVMPKYKVNCDYDINYEKYIIHEATAYDVLKKLQEETAANIYLDTINKVLHIHSPYFEKKGEVIYSMQVNIENSDLEYRKAIDKKIEVTVETVDKSGKINSKTVGTPGGDKVTVRVGAMTIPSLKFRADAELIRRTYDGYDGTFDCWLIPFVEPSYTAKILDDDYLEQKSSYYIVSVVTSFSKEGGRRTITPGIKLSIPKDKRTNRILK